MEIRVIPPQVNPGPVFLLDWKVLHKAQKQRTPRTGGVIPPFPESTTILRQRSRPATGLMMSDLVLNMTFCGDGLEAL